MSLRDGDRRKSHCSHGNMRHKIRVKEVMDALLQEIEAAKVNDVVVTSSGCMGLCSREPLVTVEILNQEPIKYEYMNPNKMRQVFKRHILAGEIQTPFVLAKGAEITR